MKGDGPTPCDIKPGAGQFEIEHSISANAFLWVLQRFKNRYFVLFNIYSDNCSNVVGYNQDQSIRSRSLKQGTLKNGALTAKTPVIKVRCGNYGLDSSERQSLAGSTTTNRLRDFRRTADCGLNITNQPFIRPGILQRPLASRFTSSFV